MNRLDRHAQALDACLEQMSSHGLPAEVALASCPETVDAPERLVSLLALAGALSALEPAPDPSPAFLSRLADALATAPEPSRLAPAPEAVESLAATLAGAEAFEAESAFTATTSNDASIEAALLELAGLAGALERLPKAEDPSDAFVAQLARSLAEAPAPHGLFDTELAEPAAESTLTLVHALENGLEALRETGLGAAIKTQDPRVAGDLTPLLALAGALRDLPAPPRPTDHFRDQLAAELAAAPEPSAIARRRAERSGMGFLRHLWRSTAFTAAAAATVILFLAAGVTYASANALPGQLLYPVKRVAETTRLWLSPSEARIGLHLDLADQRLTEALAVPSSAGERLADFSREVTAALVEVDAATDSGRDRAQLAGPVLVWLTEARGQLIAGRPQLPPTAWRGALALVDEAILALQLGQPVSSPVPRLFDRGDLLLVASAHPIGRLKRAPLVGPPAPNQAVVAARARPIAANPGSPGLVTDPVPPAPVEPALPPPAAAPADEDRDDDREQKTDDPPPSAGDSGVARATNVPPPTLAALILPTLTAMPATVEPPTATPTAQPSPTALPVFVPEIVSVGCFPRKIIEAGEAKCLVEVDDPDDPAGDGLTYSWWVAPYQGQMLDATERQATYLADFNGYGLKQTVVITIEVTDADGNTVSAETTVEVIPTGQELVHDRVD